MVWRTESISWQNLRSPRPAYKLCLSVIIASETKPHPTVSTTITAPLDALNEASARWKKTVEAELKGVPFEKKLVTRTAEGIAVQPLYTRADLVGLPNLGAAPGEAPYLRGTRPLGYKAGRWEVAQEIAAADPLAFNRALLADLMGGQDSVALTVAGDGIAGVSVDSLQDALAGVEISVLPVHLRAASNVAPLVEKYLALVKARNVAQDCLTGSVTADTLASWVRNGRVEGGLAAAMDAVVDWTRAAMIAAPRLRTVGIDATVWADAAGTSTQELAFALAAACEYLRAFAARGVAAAEVAPRMRFSFAMGPQFFTEVAKLRAFRPLLTRVLAAFGASPTAAGGVAVHATTGRWNKTLLDAHVNMLRVTTEALSAVLGGVDSLHIAPYDELTGASETTSRRIARNVHTLLAEEFGFTLTADPAGGSFYVEKLTDELGRKAWTLFQDIESKGGLIAALRTGYPQSLVQKCAAEKATAIASRRLGIVGTNLFPNLKENPLVVAPSGTSAVVGAAEITPLPACRASVEIETLRFAADAFARRTGARPKVFLVKMGPVIQHKPRADFSAGFFAVGGFEPLGKQSFDTAEAAAQAAAASGAAIAVLCSTDDTYPQLAPAFARALKTAKPEITVILAGLPADAAVVAAFREAGFDDFIHVRANLTGMLANLLKKIGAL
jgi:methylmalonyl-CoA mutase